MNSKFQINIIEKLKQLIQQILAMAWMDGRLGQDGMEYS